jgi:phenylpropionate dioxygenase-like ring-hydroxylating dioxygenase large terminal subunit
MSSAHSVMRGLLNTREKCFSLPQPLYSDADFYDIDLELLFGRCWVLAGFECQLNEPGQYFVMDIGRNSLIFVRGEDREIRGFFNTCRHRGSRICDAAAGKVKRFVCPYHNWSYRLDGTLGVAPNMHEGFVRAHFDLRAVNVQTLGGTIWVCLAKDAPDFSGHVGAVLPFLEPHGLSAAKVAHTTQVYVNANWKVVDENSRECYHCPTGHPELLRTFKNDFSRAAPEQNPAIAVLWKKCEAAGIRAGVVDAADFRISRIPFNEGIRSTTMDGGAAVSKPLAKLPFEDIGQLRWHHYPSMFGHVYNDYAMFYRMLPAGPQRTLVTATWLVNRNAQEGRDYDLKYLTEVWNSTNDQDAILSERNQRGINTDGYLPGPYNQVLERDVVKFVDWYCGSMTQALQSER